MRKAMLILALMIAGNVRGAERPVTAADAHAIFDRLKSLAGVWKSKSTKGWTETETYQIAGRGSAVFARSSFDNQPNDGMLTMFYMDGDRLLLTHYCEAGNQPTLAASSIDDDLRLVTFRFLSGTNLQKNPGHMHSVIFQFVDEDHLRSRWSFQNNSEEQWFEDVEHVRSR